MPSFQTNAKKAFGKINMNVIFIGKERNPLSKLGIEFT